MNIPSEWAVVRLKDIVLDTQPGFAQRPGEEEEEGAIPQIRTHNVSPDGQIDLTGIKYVTLPDEESDRYRLKPQDIIFNNTNSEEWVGKTALFEEEGTYLFSNHMTRIRTNQQFVEPEYLARYLHFLWQAGYSRQRAKRWVSQAAVDQSTLLEFKIPLPTLPEQQRIVAILRQADELHRLRREILEQAKKLPVALFLEMFGDPINNPQNHKKIVLGKLGQLDRGVSKHRPRDAEFLYGGDYPFVQTGDVTNSDGWITNYSQTYSEEGLAQSRLWPTGSSLACPPLPPTTQDQAHSRLTSAITAPQTPRLRPPAAGDYADQPLTGTRCATLLGTCARARATWRHAPSRVRCASQLQQTLQEREFLPLTPAFQTALSDFSPVPKSPQSMSCSRLSFCNINLKPRRHKRPRKTSTCKY